LSGHPEGKLRAALIPPGNRFVHLPTNPGDFFSLTTSRLRANATALWLLASLFTVTAGSEASFAADAQTTLAISIRTLSSPYQVMQSILGSVIIVSVALKFDRSKVSMTK
jgi:hypothetical protein